MREIGNLNIFALANDVFNLANNVRTKREKGMYYLEPELKNEGTIGVYNYGKGNISLTLGNVGEGNSSRCGMYIFDMFPKATKNYPFPTVQEIEGWLWQIVKGEEINSKSSMYFFDIEGFGTREEQLDFFSKAVIRMAGDCL